MLRLTLNILIWNSFLKTFNITQPLNSSHFHLFLGNSQQRFQDCTNAGLSAYAFFHLALTQPPKLNSDIYILHGISQWNKKCAVSLCSNSTWYICRMYLQHWSYWWNYLKFNLPFQGMTSDIQTLRSINLCISSI